MSARDDFDVIDPPALGEIALGDGATRTTVVVKAMKIVQMPAFARALRPIIGEVEAMMAAGIGVDAVLTLVETRLDDVLQVLQIATGAPMEALRDSTIDQILGAVLAVIQANKDFLNGRLAAALRTAGQIRGAGLTPSSASPAQPAGPSTASVT